MPNDKQEDVVVEVRALLAQATPGPWSQSALVGGYVLGPKEVEYQIVTALVEYDQDGEVHLEFDNSVNNMALIARAPELLKALADEVTALREQFARVGEVGLRNAELIDRIRAWSKCADGYPLDEHINNITTQLAQVTQGRVNRPRIICLCGSTRFIEQFAIKTWELERQGFIVLGCTLLPMWYCKVPSHFGEATGTKEQCDELHLRKIDLADEVLVLNVGGYIGESTANEIAYAMQLGRPVKYVEEQP